MTTELYILELYTLVTMTQMTSLRKQVLPLLGSTQGRSRTSFILLRWLTQDGTPIGDGLQNGGLFTFVR